MSFDTYKYLDEHLEGIKKAKDMVKKPVSEKKEIPIGKYKQLIGIAISYQRSVRGGLSGQAFTGYICLDCDQENNHPDDNTPFICPKCEKKLLKEYQEHGDSLYNHKP